MKELIEHLVKTDPATLAVAVYVIGCVMGWTASHAVNGATGRSVGTILLISFFFGASMTFIMSVLVGLGQ